MESKWSSTGPHPMHLCHWRQFNRFCRKKNNEPAGHTTGLALGYTIYFTDNPSLAAGGAAGECSLRPVYFFQKIHPENWCKDGSGEA